MYFSTRHKERMAAIDKGGEIKYPILRSSRSSSLKWGLVLLFIGIALAIGISLDVHYDHDGPIVSFPLFLVGAGLGLLVYYRLKGDSEETV